jgi:putative PIN family toxin of toxin-antitoxin system
MRAVVDTNVVVAGLLRPRGAPGEVLRRLRDGSFVPVVSRPILEEVESVLARPWLRTKYEVDDRVVEALLRLLALRAQLVTPADVIRRCRDPHDDRFLEAAVAGAA